MADIRSDITFTTVEAYALETLHRYRPTFLLADEYQHSDNTTREVNRYTRHVDDTAYALGLLDDPTRLAAFRRVAWYGEVGR